MNQEQKGQQSETKFSYAQTAMTTAAKKTTTHEQEKQKTTAKVAVICKTDNSVKRHKWIRHHQGRTKLYRG